MTSLSEGEKSESGIRETLIHMQSAILQIRGHTIARAHLHSVLTIARRRSLCILVSSFRGGGQFWAGKRAFVSQSRLKVPRCCSSSKITSTWHGPARTRLSTELNSWCMNDCTEVQEMHFASFTYRNGIRRMHRGKVLSGCFYFILSFTFYLTLWLFIALCNEKIFII